MKLTFRSNSWFPFDVPEKDATFASSVGPQTLYPVGLTLEQALQIYWLAKDLLIVANGTGAVSGLSQALAVNQNLPQRNAAVGTNLYNEVDGFLPAGPADLVPGYGWNESLIGSGTITAGPPAGSGTNPSALFNLQVKLFYPAIFTRDPMVRFDGKWWPAMSVSCDVENAVTLSSDGSLSIGFSCDTFNPASTTAIGAFTFFGVSVPVYCGGLASGETRSFSGALTIADLWS